MRILICGDRHWHDLPAIRRELIKVQHLNPTIIEGEATGADRIAGYVSKSMNLDVMKFPAKWDEYGKGAGPIRNKQMLDEGKPDVVWAFHSDIENSRGTKNMVSQALKARIPVIIFKS